MSRSRVLAVLAAASLFVLFVPGQSFAADPPSSPIITCSHISFDNIPTGWVVTISPIAPGTQTYGASDMPVHLHAGNYHYEWYDDSGGTMVDEGIGGDFVIASCQAPVGPVIRCSTISFDNIPDDWMMAITSWPGFYGPYDMPVYLPAGNYHYEWYDDSGSTMVDKNIGGDFVITGCQAPVGPVITCGGTVSFGGIPADWTAQIGLAPAGDGTNYSSTDFPLHLAPGDYWFNWSDAYGNGQDAPGFSGTFTIPLCASPTPTPTPTPTPSATPVPTPTPTPTTTVAPTNTPVPGASSVPSATPSATVLLPSPSAPVASATPCPSACGSAAPGGAGSNGSGDSGIPMPLLILGVLGAGVVLIGGGLAATGHLPGVGGGGGRPVMAQTKGAFAISGKSATLTGPAGGETPVTPGGSGIGPESAPNSSGPYSQSTSNIEDS